MTNAEILNLVLGAAAVILPLIFGSAWWRAKTGRLGAIIEAAALAAVEAQNRERVNAARNDPDTGGGVGSISVRTGMVAKSNAINDAVVAIAHATKTPAGEVVARLTPVIADAIEAGVVAIKKKQNPDIPPASINLFPLLALFVTLSASLSACQSLPDGWKDSNAVNLDRVAVVAAETVYCEPASPDPAVQNLGWIGSAGEAQYKMDSAIEKQERVRRAAREMMRAAKTTGLSDWGALAASIRETCAVAANDADQVLGLLLAAIRTPN